jgi:transforming growth factor-beta-induced protein
MKKKIIAILAVLAIISVGSVQADEENDGPTIVDIALQVNDNTGEFSILIAALQSADSTVINSLSGKGQYTVFAPTDAAFVSLLDELDVSAEELLSDEDLVTKVLLYHVSRGRLYAEDVLEKDRINTLIRGRSGFLYQDSGVLTDNQGRTSNILITDIEASNGIIHVIDRVVLP